MNQQKPLPNAKRTLWDLTSGQRVPYFAAIFAMAVGTVFLLFVPYVLKRALDAMRSINEDLPGFVVMTPTWSGPQEAQALYNRLWGAGFLKSQYQGVALRSSGDPVLFLSNPSGVNATSRRRMLDQLAKFNQRTFDAYGDPETQARIEQGEMAFRMQTSVPELADISGEPQHILDMYGPDVNKPGTFASSALLARRMAERGVRFVQIFHRGWDQHANVPGDLPNQCRDVDQPCWALIQDLKARGMLEDTLVVWGGEFGRTPHVKKADGRDHNSTGFTFWMAGGGVRGGMAHGTTDEYGIEAVGGKVHFHDLHATMLHLLGLNHKQLTYRYAGRDFRLTDVFGNVVTEVLA